MGRLLFLIVGVATAVLPLIGPLAVQTKGRDWFVAQGGQGSGDQASPFGLIQQAIDAAQPGDRVRVGPGTYREALRSSRSGEAGAPIRLTSEGDPLSVEVTSPGRVLTVSHAWLSVEGLLLDGQFGPDDTVRLGAGAAGFVMRDCEVRRSGRDLLDVAATSDILIERTRIHHALNSTGGRADAHGIVAGAVRRLTIRDVEIHTFSGDGIQVDPGRAAPGWDQVLVERSTIWLAPMAEQTQGFPAGRAPGENAIDTKASPAFPRASLIVRDVLAYGFRGGLLGNMAAFNIKEHVDVVIDGVTVRDSEIAFRLRGPSGGDRGGARVRVQNAVLHDVEYGVRHEDGLADFRMWNSTFGRGVSRPFQAAGTASRALDLRNLLFLGGVPPVAAHSSNRAAAPRDFTNAEAHDYTLSETSRAVDSGHPIPDVSTDRVGVARPQGRALDVGAHERRQNRPPAPQLR